MCAYQIGEHLHLTFSDHLDLYSQQGNPNFRMVSEIIGSGREVSKNTSLIWQISFNGQRCDLQIHHCFLYNRSIACSWYIKNRKKPCLRCAYQIGEHLHLTFSDHLDLYSQQGNPNFRLPSEQIPLVFWINNVPRLEYFE
jgi:hypothetical protein